MGLFSRRNGRRLLALSALAAATAAVPVAISAPWEDAVGAGSLGHSLADVIGGGARPFCSSDAPGRWTCAIPVSGSSTLAEYRLRSVGRCWTGDRHGRGGRTLPATVRGCVGIWDQLRLADRL